MAIREVSKSEQTCDGRKWVYEIRYEGKRIKSRRQVSTEDIGI